MKYRSFGRAGWQISEIGCGMWGMAEWTGATDVDTEKALDCAVENGCNFFDTAWWYGKGKSEQLLGALVKRHAQNKLYLATKIPPKNTTWPAKPESLLSDCFPADHIREYVEKSIANLNAPIDLIQFHVWQDAWAHDLSWLEPLQKLKDQGKISAIGISVNRGEPDNCMQTLQTGLIDSVQVVYNIFDQSPEDNLFPYCKDHTIAIIARVPLDEGMLSGTFTRETRFPATDWRASYFNEENLNASMERIEKLATVLPQGMTMPEMALRFILSNPIVSTTIPGMRSVRHVVPNTGASDAGPLPEDLLMTLKEHRWIKKKKR
jgi:aryl-alcohol dehydrogenase-like predicted oxidoreductase